MRKYNLKLMNRAALLAMTMFISASAFTQTDSTEATAADEVEMPKVTKVKPVKNTFPSVWIIDNQTVMVNQKKTFEMDIMHRFGTVGKGYENFWGMFAPSNIRLGFSYAPIDKLNVGLGITKDNMLWDFSAKYAIIKQTKGVYPVSVTYYGNMSYDTRKDPDGSLFRTSYMKEKDDFLAKNFNISSDRIKYFNQIIIARKFTDKLSFQVAPSWTHQNAVNGYYKRVDSVTKVIRGEMKHDHIGVSVAGRYKLTEVTAVIFNYDQPITKHKTNNPSPNIALGLEFTTSNHAFQVFLGNYFFLSPQRNSLENDNFFKNDKGAVSLRQFLIGFNVTRLWNY